MADETPQPPVSGASADSAAPVTPTPLDQLPLSEFVARRAKGESAGTPPAPVAPPAELPADGGDESGDETPLEEQPVEKGKPQPPKSRFQERIGVLTRARGEAERALASERERSARLESELQALKPKPDAADTPPQQVVADGQAPNLDQYLAAGKTYEDWMTALIDYRTAKSIELERQKLVQAQQQREIEAQQAGFKERSEAAKTKYPDYDEVVVNNDRVQLSPVMQDIARRSPHGPDIMYWLGTHEAEANQIGELTRFYPQQAYPLVEAHLLLLSGHSAGHGTPGAKKVVPVSQAPAPITPVGGGTTTQPVELDKAPLGEFVRRRNAEVAKRRTG